VPNAVRSKEAARSKSQLRKVKPDDVIDEVRQKALFTEFKNIPLLLSIGSVLGE